MAEQRDSGGQLEAGVGSLRLKYDSSRMKLHCAQGLRNAVFALGKWVAIAMPPANGQIGGPSRGERDLCSIPSNELLITDIDGTSRERFWGVNEFLSGVA